MFFSHPQGDTLKDLFQDIICNLPFFDRDQRDLNKHRSVCSAFELDDRMPDLKQVDVFHLLDLKHHAGRDIEYILPVPEVECGLAVGIGLYGIRKLTRLLVYCDDSLPEFPYLPEAMSL